jgi:Mrp family chromosome partitioning ATPase
MGRMFRLISEGSLDFPGRSSTSTVENGPFIDGAAPFIEVGGPQPIFHGLPKLPTRVAPSTPEKTETKLVPPVSECPRYVAAKLHTVAAKPAAESVSVVHPAIVTYHNPEHAASAEYFALVEELRRYLGGESTSKAILFTSAASDNGTTTVLVNLAVALAREPHSRVLVVDADFDRPGVTNKLGLSDVPGLSEVLGQTLPLAWALQPTPIAKLQVLGAGKPTTDTIPQVATDLPKLLGQLRLWFDWILIDGGVWGERPHRDATSPAFDGVYLVTRRSEMDRPVFNSLRSQVAKHGGLLRGFISTSI